MTRGITAVPGIRVGHATDREARTGCTVVLGPFRGACDVRGLASGTRELETLSPLHIVPTIDAVLLTGGSAFGLAAADGVVAWLREQGAGYDTGVARVPIVPAAVIFDLAIGAADRWPDREMGRAACAAASDSAVAEGAVGAGTGATVGKLLGIEGAERAGVGSWASSTGGYTVGALAVVNAFGDVLDERGEVLAGTRSPSGGYLDARRALLDADGAVEFARQVRERRGGARENTTLAVVATDAPLTQTALETVARAAATGVARRITPVHTPFDGDITFALSTSAEAQPIAPAELLVLGVRAADALERAIERAITAAADGA